MNIIDMLVATIRHVLITLSCILGVVAFFIVIKEHYE